MTQRTVAALVAAPLVLGLLLVAAFVPLPYATYAPGVTVDLLDQPGGSETIRVRGQKTYRDDGQLRMTTVRVSPVGDGIGLFELLGAWADDTRAVYPYDFVHPDDETAQEDEQEGAVDMVTSQDVAIALALQELDFPVKQAVKVFYVNPGSPAEGELQPQDIFLEADGEKVSEPGDIGAAVDAAGPGDEIEFVVQRDGRRRTVTVSPGTYQDADGETQEGIGIQLGVGYRYPFEVAVAIDPAIGGPSAGLMFTLAIYDTLSPGSVTGGGSVAGTGTIDAEGRVGPIGGIQQKIVGADDDGAELFLVPPDNCEDALGAPVDDIRLVRADTFASALESLETWVDDPDADLPSCEDA